MPGQCLYAAKESAQEAEKDLESKIGALQMEQNL